MTPDIVQSDVFTALRAMLLQIVPGVPIRQGIQNRIAPPKSGAFIEMTALYQSRLATSVDTYNNLDPTPNLKSVRQAIQLAIQIDCYGPDSMAWANAITTLWRDQWAVDQLSNVTFTTVDMSSGTLSMDGAVTMDGTNRVVSMAPLYCEDARMMPFETGENQYLQRWMIQAQLQYNPSVNLTQDFAVAVNAALIDVDAVYPPTF